MKRVSSPLLRIAVHLAALAPLAVLIFDALTNRLTINPIQAATRRSGDIALVVLLVSLACTPASSLFGLRQAIRFRRTIGLYAFAYAFLHFFLFFGVDYQFDLSMLIPDLNEKYYIFIGLAAFVILLALAVTSFNAWKKQLGKAWKQLHRLVYFAAPLAVLHYALARKGDIFRLRGEISWPVVALGALILLLLVRLSKVKKLFRP